MVAEWREYGSLIQDHCRRTGIDRDQLVYLQGPESIFRQDIEVDHMRSGGQICKGEA